MTNDRDYDQGFILLMSLIDRNCLIKNTYKISLTYSGHNKGTNSFTMYVNAKPKRRSIFKSFRQRKQTKFKLSHKKQTEFNIWWVKIVKEAFYLNPLLENLYLAKQPSNKYEINQEFTVWFDILRLLLIHLFTFYGKTHDRVVIKCHSKRNNLMIKFWEDIRSR